MQKWQCRYSSTLGSLEDTPQNIWGTEEYNNLTAPTVFMGMYSLVDFYALWRHRGHKAILWCGSDITRFASGYWLDNEGAIKLRAHELARWISKNCESWCENEVEKKALDKMGIEAFVCPSFLGEVEKFKSCFVPGNKVYASVSGDNFSQYGWLEIDKLAKDNPDIEFHLYGNQKEWRRMHSNLFVHGRVPKEQMNKEIRVMQGALRLNKFDGFSEVLAKSVLMGQWPVSIIPYPHMLLVEELSEIKSKKVPNIRGRDYYIKTLNKYPWIQNQK